MIATGEPTVHAILTDCGRDVTAVDPGVPMEEVRRIPDLAIETVARGFFREAERYGFRPVDYIRFFNAVLEMTGDPKAAPRRPDLAGREGMMGDSLELPLADHRVSIRPLDHDVDLPILTRWLQDEAGRMFLLAGAMTRMLELDEVVSDPANLLGIVTLPDGTPIGATAFLAIDREQRKAELRKLIGDPEMRGRGLAKAATRLWVRYGLRGLGLHKIYLSTLDTNLRNIRLNEALGFRVEGILHDEVLWDGEYHDVLRMAIWQSP